MKRDFSSTLSDLRKSILFKWMRELVAVGSGVLAGCAFPLSEWSGLAWVAPGMLLAASLGLTPKQSFRLGWLAGWVQFAISLRWLLLIPFPSGAVAGWLALSAYCGLFSALWLWLATRWIRTLASLPETCSWVQAADLVSRQPWGRRLTLWLVLAASATGLEVIRGRFLSGFPWNFYGISQWQNAPLIQIASVTGIFGVTFLVYWVSLALLGALLQVRRSSENRFGWTADLRIPLVVLLVVVGWGFRRIMTAPPEGPATTLGLVQPSIPQTLIWDDAANPERFAKVFALTETALAGRPEVLIWPEGSLPDITEAQFRAVTGLTQKAGADWIFGTGYGREVEGRREHYNAALLVDSSGRVVDRYHKRRLVIFGEFIPFEYTLPIMKWLTPIGSSFTPGKEAKAFRVGSGTNTVVSPVICFEDMFPETTRDHVTPETDFLLELTNNGWFGESSAHWQHSAGAVFRAVENGVPVVRCANNGLTCWIDEFGRTRDLLGKGGNVYSPGVLLTRVPGRLEGQPRPLTWYHRQGDVFGGLCVVVMMGMVIWDISGRRRAVRPNPVPL